jgi:hypothetical protein
VISVAITFEIAIFVLLTFPIPVWRRGSSRKKTRGQGDRETGRQGDRETGRQGDRETGRQGDREIRDSGF